MFRITLNPVTRKRLRRFRQRPRAFWSLWLLLGLYVISLGSELLCNDRPLYARFRGRSFFPALRYYPEDAFAGNGRQTRPDYRQLAGSAAFRDDPSNFMLFPPVPYGPYESIDPDRLDRHARVIVVLEPIPRVGSVNVGPDLTVARARACGFFFGTNDTAVTGLSLTDYWPLAPVLRAQVERRFANHASEPVSTDLRGAHLPGQDVILSLSAFKERRSPPRTVRLTFRQAHVDGLVRRFRFDPGLNMVRGDRGSWSAFSAPVHSNLLASVASAFAGTAPPSVVRHGATEYRADFIAKRITWPFRPVPGHWLGVDSAGRDVLARILYGLRISLTFGFLLVTVAMVAGIVVGSVQGYFGGRVDITGQRLIEIWSALPFLYVMILLGSVYGQSFGLLLFCYGIFNWIGMSYYTRAEFLRLRGQPFVDAARCLGVPAHRIIFRHVLPNALTPAVTFFPFYLVGAIGSLAALDYLGFGLPAPTPSWGELLHQAQQFRWAWWLILFPSLALFIVMLLGVFVGEGVRDAYDPRPYSRME